MADKESWKNLSHQPAVVPSVNFRGETSQAIIQPGAVFKVSVEERQMYQAKAAYDESLDKFMNGTFEPVKLIETAEDYAEIADSPERHSEDDLKALLKGQTTTVRKRLAEISNPVTVKRLIELAEEMDLSQSKMDALNEHYSEMTAVPNEPIGDGSEKPA